MTKQTNEIDEATQALREAEDKHVDLVAQHAAAERELAELIERNALGDTSVTGTQLYAARAEVELKAGRIPAAASAADEARAVRAALVAARTADEVASSITPPMVEAEVREAADDATKALGRLLAVLQKRDELSDQAGRTLATAGVPIGTTVGRIRYFPVRRDASDKGIPGAYNVVLDGEWITRRLGRGDTAREGQRRTQEALTAALRANRLRWGSRGVEAA